MCIKPTNVWRQCSHEARTYMLRCILAVVRMDTFQALARQLSGGREAAQALGAQLQRPTHAAAANTGSGGASGSGGAAGRGSGSGCAGLEYDGKAVLQGAFMACLAANSLCTCSMHLVTMALTCEEAGGGGEHVDLLGLFVNEWAGALDGCRMTEHLAALLLALLPLLPRLWLRDDVVEVHGIRMRSTNAFNQLTTTHMGMLKASVLASNAYVEGRRSSRLWHALQQLMAGPCHSFVVLLLGVAGLSAMDGGPSYSTPGHLLAAVHIVRVPAEAQTNGGGGGDGGTAATPKAAGSARAVAASAAASSSSSSKSAAGGSSVAASDNSEGGRPGVLKTAVHIEALLCALLVDLTVVAAARNSSALVVEQQGAAEAAAASALGATVAVAAAAVASSDGGGGRSSANSDEASTTEPSALAATATTTAAAATAATPLPVSTLTAHAAHDLLLRTGDLAAASVTYNLALVKEGRQREAAAAAAAAEAELAAVWVRLRGGDDSAGSSSSSRSAPAGLLPLQAALDMLRRVVEIGPLLGLPLGGLLAGRWWRHLAVMLGDALHSASPKQAHTAEGCFREALEMLAMCGGLGTGGALQQQQQQQQQQTAVPVGDAATAAAQPPTPPVELQDAISLGLLPRLLEGIFRRGTVFPDTRHWDLMLELTEHPDLILGVLSLAPVREAASLVLSIGKALRITERDFDDAYGHTLMLAVGLLERFIDLAAGGFQGPQWLRAAHRTEQAAAVRSLAVCEWLPPVIGYVMAHMSKALVPEELRKWLLEDGEGSPGDGASGGPSAGEGKRLPWRAVLEIP
ncbi:hypothetical protein HYH02_004879 [Chlamydomonas schloesseri]|uniref:Uncharacterized protein n=1 Tax=Chlamydomonas schloesseri TaxID=2026947 RepID=A0A835WPI0_9CHLO|nr:hypothetical protein HYH02_004879 [Chlamydomonas schloesseri]|eukprot:KAG2450375.1 hypothetical protein HYH02_004879 [Chlamydomonas schloesseri]